ncbi:hypothetical protein [Pseudomonas sp. 8Z]|nr:hypothetical protein [Pseudomonas sp. 8Z]
MPSKNNHTRPRHSTGCVLRGFSAQQPLRHPHTLATTNTTEQA